VRLVGFIIRINRDAQSHERHKGCVCVWGGRRWTLTLATETYSELLNTIHVIYNIIYLLTAIGLSAGGSGYFTCMQNMKLVTNKFKSGGLHEKHVVAAWNVGNRLSVCL